MSTTQAVLTTSTIFLFIMGAWPIALITAIVLIVISIFRVFKKNNDQTHLISEIEQLKTENQRLRQQLQDQAVRRAMDKAESREKKE